MPRSSAKRRSQSMWAPRGARPGRRPRRRRSGAGTGGTAPPRRGCAAGATPRPARRAGRGSGRRPTYRRPAGRPRGGATGPAGAAALRRAGPGRAFRAFPASRDGSIRCAVGPSPQRTASRLPGRAGRAAAPPPRGCATAARPPPRRAGCRTRRRPRGPGRRRGPGRGRSGGFPRRPSLAGAAISPRAPPGAPRRATPAPRSAAGRRRRRCGRLIGWGGTVAAPDAPTRRVADSLRESGAATRGASRPRGRSAPRRARPGDVPEAGGWPTRSASRGLRLAERVGHAGEARHDGARPGEQLRPLVALLVGERQPQFLDPFAQPQEDFDLRPREVGEAVHEDDSDLLEGPAPAVRRAGRARTRGGLRDRKDAAGAAAADSGRKCGYTAGPCWLMAWPLIVLATCRPR